MEPSSVERRTRLTGPVPRGTPRVQTAGFPQAPSSVAPPHPAASASDPAGLGHDAGVGGPFLEPGEDVGSAVLPVPAHLERSWPRLLVVQRVQRGLRYPEELGRPPMAPQRLPIAFSGLIDLV